MRMHLDGFSAKRWLQINCQNITSPRFTPFRIKGFENDFSAIFPFSLALASARSAYTE